MDGQLPISFVQAIPNQLLRVALSKDVFGLPTLPSVNNSDPQAERIQQFDGKIFGKPLQLCCLKVPFIMSVHVSEE